MEIKTTEKNNKVIAILQNDQPIITDARSALDCMVTVKYETGSERIVISKELIAGEFFVLSTGLAGEILQKFINYGMKIAIYGDYSGYTSKPLKDFIYESNRGRDIFFMGTEEEAIGKLAAV